MKRITSIIVISLVTILCGVSFAADPLNFRDLSGQNQVQFGTTYTYSVIVEGDFDKGKINWSATGGKVVDDWWEGDKYYCKVEWRENNPDDPAKIKISGVGKDSDELKAERLYVTEKSASRGLDFGNLRNDGGKCLDVPSNELQKNGGTVQVWECTNDTRQKWKFDNQGRIVNQGGRCLDVHAPDLHKDGGKVQIWACNNDIQQRWKLDDKGRLVSGGGKCLEIYGPDMTKDGGKVQILQCHDDKNQRWRFE